MPRIFRAMLVDDKGHPLVGGEDNQLGVRAPPHERADVHPDAEGCVEPGEGMSVAPHWSKLPPFLIPKRLKQQFPKARGDDALVCFRHGEGVFADGAVANALAFRKTNRKHGQVEPICRVSLDRFRAALAATRDDWQKDETP